MIYFDRSGNYLGRFGTFTSGTDGFALPNGITADGSGQIYVTDATLGVVYRFDPVGQ